MAKFAICCICALLSFSDQCPDKPSTWPAGKQTPEEQKITGLYRSFQSLEKSSRDAQSGFANSEAKDAEENYNKWLGTVLSELRDVDKTGVPKIRGASNPFAKQAGDSIRKFCQAIEQANGTCTGLSTVDAIWLDQIEHDLTLRLSANPYADRVKVLERLQPLKWKAKHPTEPCAPADLICTQADQETQPPN